MNHQGTHPMTLYLKLSPTPDTIVFSGDRRFIDDLRFTDNNVKATRLGGFSVGGATGATRHVDRRTGDVQRDVHALFADFYDSKDVTPETLAEFADELKKQHDAYVAKFCKGRTTPAKGVFTIVVSTRVGEKVTDRHLIADIIEDDKLSVRIRSLPCNSGTLFAYGDPAIRAALENRDPTLADLYRDSDIEQLLLDPKCQFDVVNIERAAQICRKIHKLCGEQARRITRARPTISPECDVLIVDAQGVRMAP
jgi:hypothetical protein